MKLTSASLALIYIPQVWRNLAKHIVTEFGKKRMFIRATFNQLQNATFPTNTTSCGRIVRHRALSRGKTDKQ